MKDTPAGSVSELLEHLHSLLAQRIRFSSSAWKAAGARFSARRFAAGEHVIEAGKRVCTVGFLLQGFARYYYLTPSGEEFNKSFAKEGQVLSCISSLVAGEPSPFFIQALEPCQCLFLEYQDLQELCRLHPEWGELVRHLLEQLALKKERREADFLLLSAQERYQKFLQEYADIASRIPNYHIASYIGITEVSLSRIRRRMGYTEINKG